MGILTKMLVRIHGVRHSRIRRSTTSVTVSSAMNRDDAYAAKHLYCIEEDADALRDGAQARSMDEDAYRSYLDARMLANSYKAASAGLTANRRDEFKDDDDMDAGDIEITADELADDPSLILADDDALKAGAELMGMGEQQLTDTIHRAMVAGALSNDKGLDFDVKTYGEMLGGTCLLILAFGAIGFFASCVFDRTGSAMAIGGGLPIAFFLIGMVVQMGGSAMENFKYLTLVTLNDTSAMLAGTEFWQGLVALAAISVVLYAAGCTIFCKKDLPL